MGRSNATDKPAAAVLEQILVALVGFLRRGEAGELAHGPELAAIAGGVNAAREGRLAGIAEILVVAPVLGQIGLRVEPANRHAGDRGEARVAVLVEIDAGGRADRALGRLLERGRQRLLSPLLLRVGRMAILKNIGDGTLGDLRRLRRVLLCPCESPVLL